MVKKPDPTEMPQEVTKGGIPSGTMGTGSPQRSMPTGAMSEIVAAQGSWATVNPMPVTRFDLAVVVNGPDSHIYAIGGNYSGPTSAYLPLNHVEVYDPVADFWKAVRPMQTSRGGPAAAVHDGLIYVFGGHDCNIVPRV